MKLFSCDKCGSAVYFENVLCESCNSELGYIPEANEIKAVGNDTHRWQPLADAKSHYRRCGNFDAIGCNWLVPETDANALCTACQCNRTIPDMAQPDALAGWQKVELAKRRMIYGLLRFALPFRATATDNFPSLTFDFLSDDVFNPDAPPVITGHDNGVITLNIKEANPGERERIRMEMGEAYRTLLGHFRHEVGHYYWQVLISRSAVLDEFRQMFGDERADYQESLSTHYANQNDGSWQENFVSFYASAHPWEDFAETWAHYMHMVDTLETAAAHSLTLRSGAGGKHVHMSGDYYRESDFNSLVEEWLPVTISMNNLNRSMGHHDLYPFVLTAPVIEKLRFVHNLVRRHRNGTLS
ncbi:MAG TPA: hypothetical protein DDW95_14485 [Alphaproteobacteria bacterium]|nr:hypothetical protein [Alphaproteobacteria bacterium]HAM48031.1 hypothetical protein [Alphaproteobacteria bacterium]HBF99748.1 hypothetical protein [Alphaproteobacteria bacterium]